MATLEALRDKETRRNKFMAALQGIELNKEKEEEEQDPVSLSQIMERVNAKISGDAQSLAASNAGFTEDMGLGYEVIGG
jgi:hypothetical protein